MFPSDLTPGERLLASLILLALVAAAGVFFRWLFHEALPFTIATHLAVGLACLGAGGWIGEACTMGSIAKLMGVTRRQLHDEVLRRRGEV